MYTLCIFFLRHDHCKSLPGWGPVEKSGARHSRRHPHPYEQHFRSANKDGRKKIKFFFLFTHYYSDLKQNNTLVTPY